MVPTQILGWEVKYNGITLKVEIVACLGDTLTVFEDKLHAIELGLRKMFSGGYEKRLINILSDCKDSILAISVVGIRSKLMVLECLNVLKSFTCHNKFTWVWGHTGIVGMKLLEEGQQHIHASTQSPYKILSYKFLTKHSGL